MNIEHGGERHIKKDAHNLTLRHNWRQTRPPVLSCLPRNLYSVLSSLHFRCRAATARRAPQSCCPSWAKHITLSLLIAISCFCCFVKVPYCHKHSCLVRRKMLRQKEKFVQLTFLRFSDEINKCTVVLLANWTPVGTLQPSTSPSKPVLNWL